MAKAELFRIPAMGWFVGQLKAFPVKRGEADRGALKRALAYLEAGHTRGKVVITV